jgi:hypothetical protein
VKDWLGFKALGGPPLPVMLTGLIKPVKFPTFFESPGTV